MKRCMRALAEGAETNDDARWYAPFDSGAFASVAPYAERLAHAPRFPTVGELDAALRDRLRLAPPITLEPQVKIRRRRRPVDRDALYEVRIELHRRLPTREGSWHDLANALVWAAFPRAKRALAAHACALLLARLPEAATRLPGARTPEQDAIAMLDEGGVVLLCEARHVPAARAAHEAGDAAALARLRDEGHVFPLVFGHALLEHVALGTLDARGFGVVLAMADVAPSSCEARVELADVALALWIRQGEGLAGARGLPALPLSLTTETDRARS